MTEWLHFHFPLSCTGEGHGSPLQCSCLENPRGGEPGGLPSVGSHGVDWSDLAAAAAGLCPWAGEPRTDCWCSVLHRTGIPTVRVGIPWLVPKPAVPVWNRHSKYWVEWIGNKWIDWQERCCQFLSLYWALNSRSWPLCSFQTGTKKRSFFFFFSG